MKTSVDDKTASDKLKPCMQTKALMVGPAGDEQHRNDN